MKKLFLLILYLNLIGTALCQSHGGEVELFPKQLNMLPAKANYQEPKIGILYDPQTANLKVDIGNSIDILGYRFDDGGLLTIGVDFMGYAYVTSFRGNRLQIDALDGFFGGNFTFVTNNSNNFYFSRLKIVHNSSHLVDGSYDKSIGAWMKQEPIPYTKDFLDLSVGRYITTDFGTVKYYTGPTFSWLVRPETLKRWEFNAGGEIIFENMLGSIYSQKLNLFFSYHFNLEGIPEYIGNNNLLAGFKLGDWNSKGVSLYFSYYCGSNPFNEYYKKRIKKIGIGFTVDFI